MIALILFVAAVVVFVVRLLGGPLDSDWGFVFIAAGLAVLAAGLGTDAGRRIP